MGLERQDRRLAAILSADMVGYSRLVEVDETGTITRQKGHRNELIDPNITDHNGRIVKTTGDGLLVEFASVVDATACAVAIQRAMEKREAGVSKDRRIQYRMGINLGDIVIDGDDIFGDGVNVASRLEGLAEPGGVCISGTAHDHLKQTVEAGYEYLGERRVKNIETPIRVYRVLLEPDAVGQTIGERSLTLRPKQFRVILAVAVALIATVAATFWWQPWVTHIAAIRPAKMALPLPDRPSIAVLPFRILSDDGTKDVLVNGLSENIISALSSISEMFVVASGSTFAYKAKSVKPRQVAEELGVRYVLAGSVQQSGDRVRVTVQLIDAVKGHYLWSGRFDRKLTDLFAVQDEITRKIVVALQVELTRGEQARMQFKHSTSSIEAWLLSVQARALLESLGKEENSRAYQLLFSSLKLDPDFSGSWGIMAWVHWQKARHQFGDRTASLASAKAAVKKALELNDANTDALTVRAAIHLVEGNYSNAVTAFKTAIAVNPNNALGMAMLAGALTYVGRPEEAILMIKRAMRLAPNYPAWYPVILGRAYRIKRQFGQAVATIKNAVRRNPNSIVFQVELTVVLSEAGHAAEARAAATKVVRLNPKFSVSAWAKSLAYKDPVEQRRIIDALIKTGLPE